MSTKATILWRVYLAFFLLIALSFGVIYRIVKIQFVEGEDWRSLADSLTTAYVTVEPNRGNIYARDGSLLSASLSTYELRLDLGSEALLDEVFFDEVDSLSHKLAAFFQDKSAQQWQRELMQAHRRRERYHLIKKRVSHVELKEIKKFPLFRLGRYRGGLIIEQKSHRKRPFKLLAQRTIGYKRESIQPVGLEGAFDHYLAGQTGKRLMQKVSSRTWIPINDRNEIEPHNGQDIITTIDVNIQDFAEQALKKAVSRHKADHGCAVVMEVATGHILGIANLGISEDGEDYIEKYNYAVGESTEPGSTFKLASTIALLESGFLQPDDTINCFNGSYDFYGTEMRDSRPEGYGTISIQRAIEVSSNIGIARACDKAFEKNPRQFIALLKQMRLHEPLDIPIVGEGLPFIKEPNHIDWSRLSIPWMSHGYELRLTPLQILALYAAVANGGTMMKPLFVTEVRQVAEIMESFQPVVRVPQICSPKTIKQVHDILVGAVDSGTAENLLRPDPGFRMAGKTGTAVISKANGVKEYQASFAGYFPVDKPKYACIVVINKPKSGYYYGGQVAAPVFKEIASKIFSYDVSLSPETYIVNAVDLDTRPKFLAVNTTDMDMIYKGLQASFPESQAGFQWGEPSVSATGLAVSEKVYAPDAVPDVRGLCLADALFVCENMGLQVESHGEGIVYLQNPIKGQQFRKGQKIRLKLR